MSNSNETIRELNVSELDLVGGGLSASVGGLSVTADISSEFNAVHGAVGGALDRLGVTASNGGLLGTVLGAVNGVAGKV